MAKVPGGRKPGLNFYDSIQEKWPTTSRPRKNYYKSGTEPTRRVGFPNFKFSFDKEVGIELSRANTLKDKVEVLLGRTNNATRKAVTPEEIKEYLIKNFGVEVV